MGTDIALGRQAPRPSARRRHKDFIDRCHFVSKLPRQQRGACVADSIASLWLAGCNSYTAQQQSSAVTAAFDALYKGTFGQKMRRSRGVAHVLGPSPHVTHLPAASLFSWLRETLRASASGRADWDHVGRLWEQRSRAWIGSAAQCNHALRAIGLTWSSPTRWNGLAGSFDFSLPAELFHDTSTLTTRTVMSSPSVRRLLHDCRDFLRDSILSFEAVRRRKDFAGLERGWDRRYEVRNMMYAAMLARGGPSLLAGGIWTTLKAAMLKGTDGCATCVRCNAAL